MADESTGEWKLVKAWECKKCKLLIKDGRQIFDHDCTDDSREYELSKLRSVIEDQNKVIEERSNTIQEINKSVEQQKNYIRSLENSIGEFNDIIISRNNAIIDKEDAIEKQKTIIDDQKKTIIEQSMTIDAQKKNQNKVIEKIVYVDSNANAIANENVQNINVDIWKKDFRVKDSRDGGYREDIEIEIFEKGKGKEKIIIKNGKVLKKPDDIIVIGKHEPDGFAIKGIYRN